jgi:hypothetical protein
MFKVFHSSVLGMFFSSGVDGSDPEVREASKDPSVFEMARIVLQILNSTLPLPAKLGSAIHSPAFEWERRSLVDINFEIYQIWEG